ncbi:helix-turn-helix domain-containing protein [bacterium]|nr:helix-turn-helix domain-containing protein [bacterium]
MRTFAYDEEYVTLAQRVMGDMLDYAVNTLNYELQNFYRMFLISGIARQFEIGNPAYVAGRNGCEAAKEVIVLSGLDMPEAEDLMYLDKSPEYWTGWALAYYQWKSGQSFRQIDHAVSIDTVCAMYDPLHEADIEKFVYIMNEKLKQQDVSRLRRLRTYAKLSQRQLAEAADVPIRQIQLFEQGERDINKTQGMTLLKLSRVLKCRPEELLAYVDCL